MTFEFDSDGLLIDRRGALAVLRKVPRSREFFDRIAIDMLASRLSQPNPDIAEPAGEPAITSWMSRSWPSSWPWVMRWRRNTTPNRPALRPCQPK